MQEGQTKAGWGWMHATHPYTHTNTHGKEILTSLLAARLKNNPLLPTEVSLRRVKPS